MLKDLVNVTQVSLTITFCMLTFWLLKSWWSGFKATIKHPRSSWSHQQWLLVGIVIGFGGGFADQLYWGLHWLAVLFDADQKEVLLELGPTSNVFSRQIPGVISVYCHLRAAEGLNNHLEALGKKTRNALGVSLAAYLILEFFVMVR